MGHQDVSSTRPLVVIGGGPAGMTAALEAARGGLAVTLVDESTGLGGQVYRRPPGAFRVEDRRRLGRDFDRGERLRAELLAVADRVEILSGTSVLAVWPGREVLWARGDASGVIRAERLIIASGAYDRPVAFPGWTRPGVLTAGGAQTLMKTMCIRPGRRALVSGTGPLVLGVARRLHETGVEVVSVLEAGDPRWLTDGVPHGGDEWDATRDVQESLEVLRRARIPVLANHTIFEALGPGTVQGAAYGPVDPETWWPIGDRAQHVDVDLVVVGFGFVPRTELTELAGCRHRYVPELGGWVPVRDDLMQTTASGVFAVGDGAGIGGVAVAIEEGRVAGITAAERAGTLSSAEAADRRAGPFERLRSLAAVWSILNEGSRIRPGLLELAGPETLACRCEEVTFAEVQAAIDGGARDLHAVKLITRLGMGPCQGRNCAPHVGMQLCSRLNRAPEDVGRINPRPPVQPVTLGALATMAGPSETTAVDPLDAVGGGAS